MGVGSVFMGQPQRPRRRSSGRSTRLSAAKRRMPSPLCRSCACVVSPSRTAGAGVPVQLDVDASVAVRDHGASSSQGGAGGGSASSMPASSGRQPQRLACA